MKGLKLESNFAFWSQIPNGGNPNPSGGGKYSPNIEILRPPPFFLFG